MNKLIKISDYYYVIDTDTKIKEGDIIISHSKIYNPDTRKPFTIEKVVIGLTGYAKIIATTNLSLQLPQITTASDDMVNKEVEVEFTINCPNCKENYLHPFNSEDETVCSKCSGVFTKKECKVAILKPISKETSTNSLEYADVNGLNSNPNDIEKAFIAGANWQIEQGKLLNEERMDSIVKNSNIKLSKMYTEKEVKQLLEKLLLSSVSLYTIEEWFEQNKKK